MILGWHNMTDAVAHYFKDHVSPDRDPSLLLLDGVLLIPLIFAVFFYPVEVLTFVAAVVLLGFGFRGLTRILQRHRMHVGQ